MDYLPLFHRLTDAEVLVVGGGDVALRKVRLLRDAGASVRVIAPDIAPEILSMAGVRHEHRAFTEADVSGVRLVVAATNVPDVNREVSLAARAANIPVNVVDDASLSTVIFPGIVDRGPVVLAVSSSGRSPTLTRMLRARIESILPRRLGELAEFLGNKRAELKRAGKMLPRSAWETLVNTPPEALEQTFARLLQEPVRPTGWVALVGAGPGDPELVTLKALQFLQQADVVLYDNLVSAAVLDYARRDARRVYVGKKRAFSGARQEDIHRQMLQAAQAGLNVVRLKGGDPFIFGRGGEEIATLVEEGVQCVVVPGITAALGAASYAGIPLTYRNQSQSVRFLTGHRARGSVDIRWQDLVAPGQTLVFYMGLFNLPDISGQLIEHGMPADTPAALIENATLRNQRVLTGTIGSLAEQATAAAISGPSTVIVGHVVLHRHVLESPASGDD
ncbi:MAG: siroheme synthase CysG [Pseudomonadales bacterium]